MTRRRLYLESCWTAVRMNPRVLINAGVARPRIQRQGPQWLDRGLVRLLAGYDRGNVPRPTAKTARTATPNTHKTEAAITDKNDGHDGPYV